MPLSRALAQELRETFDDLTSPWRRLPDVSLVLNAPEAARQISLQQLRKFFDKGPSNLTEAFAGITLWVLVLWILAPGLKVVAWGFCMYSFLAAALIMSHRYARLQPADDALRPWEVARGRLSTLQGLCWGCVWFLFPAQARAYAPYAATGLLLVIAGSLSMQASYRPAVSWLSVPCAALTCLALVASGTVLDVTIGLGFAAAVGLMIRLGRVQNALITQSMQVAQERVLLLEELEGQRAAAQQANEAKTRFLAAVSHDLRQPMHSIALLSGALQRPKGVQADALRQIGASVQVMDDMLTALLDVSKLDDGALPLQLAPLSLGALFERIELQFAAQALAKGLAFEVRACSQEIVSDSYQLQRMLGNLVANAIRYTQRGKIVVRCRTRGEFAWLQVWDSGVGVAREDRKRIFEEFVQLEPGRQLGDSGSGLGLSIVRMLAQRLHYPLVLRSRPGQGSMFAVAVPVHSPTGAEATALTGHAALAGLLRGQLALLIDDDVAALRSMRLLLEAFHCHVLSASCVASAIAAVQGSLRTPDFLISDFRLSDGNTGLDAIAQVRDTLGETVPALLVTAEPAAARVLARPQGITVLPKPLQTQSLAIALRHALGAVND
jgi:two-component system, sensor histidine kinase